MAVRSGPEARRSARVATSFLVAIEGVDSSLIPRKGDISATGVYFETTGPVGKVGTVQVLRIASSNRAKQMTLMGHVVRTITLDDVGGRTVSGVAFEFMPESEDAAAAIERFVQYVLLVVEEPQIPGSESEPRLSPRLAAHALAAERSDEGAVIRKLSVRSMTLEASWAVQPGEHLRVDIAAPGMARRVRLEGPAVRVTPRGEGGGPYEIEVQFQSEVERPPGVSSMSFIAVRPEDHQKPESKAAPSVKPATITTATRADDPSFLGRISPPLPDEDEVSSVLDDLFSALIHPPDDTKPKREHLSGSLSRIRLPTLCALFDMERLSGNLMLKRAEEQAIIYVQNGRLIDVDQVPEGKSPRSEIARLLNWSEGTFEFDVHPVHRTDRIGESTTALLLDLARESDEAAAAAAEAQKK